MRVVFARAELRREEEEEDDPEAGKGRPALDWKNGRPASGQRAAALAPTPRRAPRAYVHVVGSGLTRLDRGEESWRCRAW